jgi:hypothetical protein
MGRIAFGLASIEASAVVTTAITLPFARLLLLSAVGARSVRRRSRRSNNEQET